jgi:hypothetical protein
VGNWDSITKRLRGHHHSTRKQLKLYAEFLLRTPAAAALAAAAVPVLALENQADRRASALGSPVVLDQSFQATAPEYQVARD